MKGDVSAYQLHVMQERKLKYLVCENMGGRVCSSVSFCMGFLFIGNI